MFQEWGNCVVNGVATLRCLPVVFHNAVSGFLVFVGAVSMFYIIFSAYKFITSGGDPKQVEAARKIMTYAIIGMVVVLSSFTILNFVGFITKSSDCITSPDKITTGGCK